jgi:hypothetical protein
MEVSGCATAATDDGTHRDAAGRYFLTSPPGHESWAVGDEPYVFLHFIGPDAYAAGNGD